MSAGSHATQSVAYDAPKPVPGRENEKNPPRIFSFEVPAAEKANRQVEWTGLRNRYATAILLAKEDLTWIQRVEFRATEEAGGPRGTKLKALAVEAPLREAVVDKRSSVARFSLVLAPIRAKELEPVKGAEEHLLSYGCWGLFNPIGKVFSPGARCTRSATRAGHHLTTLIIRLPACR